MYDRHAILLPAVGIVLSLTAAFDFRKAHARVKNVASGTLDDDQTVTFSEMVEHSFYQVRRSCEVHKSTLVTSLSWCWY